MRHLSAALVACAFLGLPSFACAETVFQSGSAQVALLELYTSEGCSSCPPAEKWLGELRQHAGLWTKFVPVAFHVDYWDRLGWRDVFARRDFTARQHAYAAAWRSASVYTPCFVRNGTEWQARSAGPLAGPVAPDAGRLTVRWREDGTCQVTFVAGSTPPPGSLEVVVALLGSGIVSRVGAGENAGRNLPHEFVALQLETAPLHPGAGGLLSAQVTLRVDPARKLPVFPRRAIAAWVTRRGDLAPVQATGGWIE